MLKSKHTMHSRDGHYALLILPLSIITIFCFGFLMTQPAAGKLKKTTPASSNPAPVAGEATETLPALPFADAGQLPQLSTQPVTTDGTALNTDEAPINTASPQSSAVSLPDLQGTTNSSVIKLNISLPSGHKHSDKAKPRVTRHH